MLEPPVLVDTSLNSLNHKPDLGDEPTSREIGYHLVPLLAVSIRGTLERATNNADRNGSIRNRPDFSTEAHPENQASKPPVPQNLQRPKHPPQPKTLNP